MYNFVETNSDGFHDVEHIYEKKETKRKMILVIGDSFTASIHVPISKTWTQILERQLHHSSVVNLGLDGTGTDVHLAILEEYFSEHKADTVILAFNENDIIDIHRKKRFRECYKRYVLRFEDHDQKERLRSYIDQYIPNTVSRGLFDISFTFRLASRLLPGGQLLSNNMISPFNIGLNVSNSPAPQQDLDELLIKFKQLSEQSDFRLLIIPVPTKQSPTGSLNALKENASQELLAELEVVDIAPLVSALLESQRKEYSDLFWKYDSHFNAEGNEMFGIAVAKFLGQQTTSASDAIQQIRKIYYNQCRLFDAGADVDADRAGFLRRCNCQSSGTRALIKPLLPWRRGCIGLDSRNGAQWDLVESLVDSGEL